MRKIRVILIILITIILSGCEPIFETGEVIQSIYDKTEIREGIYYAKDASKFIEIYLPAGNSQRKSTKKDTTRFFYNYNNDFEKIPYLFKGEIIAYQSSKVSELNDVYIERYKDIGKSLGFHSATYNSTNNSIEIKYKNCIEGSTFYEVLYDAPGNLIQITSINGEPVQKAMLNEAGIMTGLESDALYDIEYYCGTYYGKIRVSADVHYLQSYEMYNLGDMKKTKNGYLSIEFPEDYKPGYYNINGCGLVFYTGHEKGYDIASLDINEPYYESLEGEMSSYAQQYVVSVPDKTLEVTLSVEYNETFAGENIDDISITLCSPSGELYDMETDNGLATCTLSEMMAGKWSINIIPKDLIVGNINVSSAKTKQEATKEDFDFFMLEDTSNIRFFVHMEGNESGDYWAVITDENGKAYSLNVDERKMYMSYTFDYIPAGNYTLSVYHYTDTKIAEADYEKNVDNGLTEIITVTE